MKPRKQIGWAVKWVQVNRLDGRTEHFMGLWYGPRPEPAFFSSRQAARQWRDQNYGYIRNRKDLRKEPHGWKLPQIVRAEISLREIR